MKQRESASMAFSPNGRLDPDPKNPRRRTKNPNTHKASTSHTSSRSLLMEPPPNFFPSKPELLKLIAVVAIAATVAVACNYASNFLGRRSKPFCDSDADFDYYPSSESCEPCPRHGKCHEGELQCASGFKKVGKLCLEDGDIEKTADKLSKLVQRHVCEAYARFLCQGAGSAWTLEGKLWNDLDGSMLKDNLGLDTAVYELAKERAMETTGKLLESGTSIEGNKKLKCPDLLVESYKPFHCFVRQWIIEHAAVLVPLCALLIGSMWILLKLRQRFYRSSRAEVLYSQICDILEEHALISRNSSGQVEPWVVTSWLRDHLLLPKERKDPLLWKKVEEFVQEDSRLDRYPKLVKGESKVVWEWQVEGSLSSSRRRKKTDETKLKATEEIAPSPSRKWHYWGLKAGELLKS